jgi:SAM-dependent methyltransferase
VSADEATLAFYQTNAPRYTLNFAQSHSRHLDAFLDRLPGGAAALELGCGAGRDAERMLARGFAVDATDGSAAMVTKARERHGVSARVMRFDELTATEVYDAVWAHACLLHVPRSAMPEVLTAIHRALRPGGWHYASFKLGTGEGRDALGRLHNFPSSVWLDESYAAANFELAQRVQFPGEGADGVMRDWYALTVRKTA